MKVEDISGWKYVGCSDEEGVADIAKGLMPVSIPLKYENYRKRFVALADK